MTKNCPKCGGKDLRLISNGYDLKTYQCGHCKTNIQVPRK